MSTSSSIQGSSTYSNSNSPTEQQQQQMALGFNQFFDQQQKLDQQLPPLSLPAAPPSSIQNAQLQLLEALAKAGLLPPIPAAAGQKEDEIAQQLLNGFTKDSNNNNAKMNLSDVQQPPTQRKRRRLIGNLDNTLDGLVAKRVDQTPLKRRYQTETEAIELPDDEVEIKRMEADPDVCTRMCSVCGYQGKWVSEMIRHKRVHTNDRPFKCKYCNRTSKWKADLIRHVAKTHGIRVVSKYSRSKAFEVGKPAAAAQPTEDDVIVLNDNFSAAGNFSSSASECGSDQQHQHSHSHSSSAQSMASFEDENNNNNNTGIGISKGGKKYADSFDHLNSVQRKAQRLNSISRPSQQQQQKKGGGGGEQGKAQQAPDMLSQLLAFPGNLAAAAALQAQQQKAAQQQNVYKCGSCIYEQSSFPVLVSHLLSAHRLSPFFCQLCSRPFNELVSAGEHFAAGQCPPLALKANFVVKAAANGKLQQQQQQQQMTTPSLGQFGPLIAAQRPGMPNSLDQLLAASLLPTSSAAAFNNKATFPALFNPPPSMVGGGGLFPTSALFPSAGAGFPASLFNPTSLGNSCCSPDSVLSSFGSLNSLVNFDKQSKMEKLAKTDGESKEEEEEEEKHGLEEEQEEEENKSQSASVDLNLLMSAKHLSPAHSPVETVTATANQQTKEEEADETEKDPATAAARLLLKAIQQQLAAGANSKSCGSAFTPVNNAMKPAAKPQQQDCPASATAASLAAFGQFLAELQSRTSSQQQQQATTATMFH